MPNSNIYLKIDIFFYLLFSSLQKKTTTMFFLSFKKDIWNGIFIQGMDLNRRR
jgi:hypothetical protein